MTDETGGNSQAQVNFTVSLAGEQVVIVGDSGGNVRGKGGRKVTFSRGPGVSAFSITCTDFPDNGDPVEPAWPFEEAPPAMPVTSFEGKLVKPKKGAALLIFKYTISVAGKTAADPIIIVDH